MKKTPSRRWLARLLACDLCLLAALIAWVVTQAVPSSEAVRLRNALLYGGVVSEAMLNWTPTTTPKDFRLDVHPPPQPLRGVAESEQIASLPGNWAKAKAIAEHLQGKLSDKGPIMAGLAETYRRIVNEGAGYCGDFADVFAAMATAAGIPNRRWSFSFDGYGGHGHIFNEVWDDGAGRWRAIDVFNNYVFLDAATGEILSAIEFRATLRGERGPARIQVLNPTARPGYTIMAKAEDYYRRGAAQWYLLWGSNVVAEDEQPVVVLAGRISRHLEQLAAIAVGVYPKLMVIEAPESVGSQQALSRLGTRLRLAAFIAVLLTLAAAVLVWRLRSTTTGNVHDNGRGGAPKCLVSLSSAPCHRLLAAWPINVGN